MIQLTKKESNEYQIQGSMYYKIGLLGKYFLISNEEEKIYKILKQEKNTIQIGEVNNPEIIKEMKKYKHSKCFPLANRNNAYGAETLETLLIEE